MAPPPATGNASHTSVPQFLYFLLSLTTRLTCLLQGPPCLAAFPWPHCRPGLPRQDLVGHITHVASHLLTSLSFFPPMGGMQLFLQPQAALAASSGALLIATVLQPSPNLLLHGRCGHWWLEGMPGGARFPLSYIYTMQVFSGTFPVISLWVLCPSFAEKSGLCHYLCHPDVYALAQAVSDPPGYWHGHSRSLENTTNFKQSRSIYCRLFSRSCVWNSAVHGPHQLLSQNIMA